MCWRNRLGAAVFQAHYGLVVLGGFHPLLDLVADVGATRSPGDRGDRFARAMAHLIAKQGSGQTAGDFAKITAVALDLDHVDGLDRAAIGAIAGSTAGTRLMAGFGYQQLAEYGIGFPLTDAQMAAHEELPDHTIRIGTGLVEVGAQRILSTATYNGQFPGPLLRLKEGLRVVVDIHNDTDTPEQLHWHGQFLPTDVDGTAEEGTPYIPAHGTRRIAFTPGPSGFRFYHTHLRAGSNLHAGQYSGLVGPVYIEARNEPGAYPYPLADSCGSPLAAIEHPILTVTIQQHPRPRNQLDPARIYPIMHLCDTMYLINDGSAQ